VILDTSAILAVVFREPEREEFLRKIGAARIVGVGAPTLVESTVVVSSRLGEATARSLVRILERTAIVVVSFETQHWQVAADAWLRFGRRRHPASLNFGDCLAYATARIAGEPLLCKGDDFLKTDLVLA
jgi:ribonuclease VapC